MACIGDLDVDACCYIFNPITKDQIAMPIEEVDYEFEINWWGFGCSPSTMEYKFLFFRSSLEHGDADDDDDEEDWEDHERNKIVDGAIFALGSESWKGIPHLPSFCASGGGADCGGTLFWKVTPQGSKDVGLESLCSFDVESEEFRGWLGPYKDMRHELCGLVRDGTSGVELSLVIMGDTVGCARKTCTDYCIWTLRDKVNEVWVKDYNFGSLLNVEVRNLWMKCDLLGVESITIGAGRHIKNVTYDTKEKEFTELILPFGENNADGSPRRMESFFSHAATLVSPIQIVAMARKSSTEVLTY